MFTNHDHGLAAQSANEPSETAVVSSDQMVVVCA